MRVVSFLAGLFAGAILVALGFAHALAETPPDNLLFNGDFEAGDDGWLESGAGVTFTVDGDGPVVAGSLAGRIHMTGFGEAVLRSRYWLTEVEAGATYRAAAHLHSDDLALDDAEIRLRFLDEANAVLSVHAPASPVAGGMEPFTRYETSDVQAPPGAAYARLSVRIPTGAPDTLVAVDDASLVLVAPPPPPPPPDPVGSPPPTATATPSSTPGPTPTVDPTATPTPNATPPPGIAPVLRNASFDEGLQGWEITRGDGDAQSVLPGFGLSLVLRAGGTTTMWAQQAVTVAPGAWYNASAILAPGAHVGAGWVRIAWYSTTDASGAQMSTVDSPVVTGGSAFQHIEFVETGPVQAPLGARSARVRLLLRPAVPGATLAFDDAVFHPTSPPPPPTPTPSATLSPTPESTPSPTIPVAVPATPTPPSPGPVAPSPSPPGDSTTAAAPAPPSIAPAAIFSPEQLAALAAGQGSVRITELLPNAVQPGIDADYEWVELTNIGPTSVSLQSMRLEDNRDSLEMHAVVLAPGGSLVIAAPLADVGDAAVVQRVPVIGNGLSNTGDRLALTAADGTLVDALSYGSDDTYAADERIAAPRPGYSIVRVFASDGTLVEVHHSATPSPGSAEVLEPAALASEVAVAPVESSDPDEGAVAQPAAPGPALRTAPAEPSMWVALFAVAGAALAAIAIHRVAVTVRTHRRAPGPAPALVPAPTRASDDDWLLVPPPEEPPGEQPVPEAPPLWLVPPTPRTARAVERARSAERRHA